MTIPNNKYFDSSWDFIGANTKKYTHCYHTYPAMMIPQVAARLLAKYGTNAQLLFDPYCGTGTSLLEANLNNIQAIGTDLNPLARLIAETKTTPVNLEILDLYLDKLNYYLFNNVDTINIVIPAIKNIDYWFDRQVQQKLAILKDFIEKISDRTVQNFFKVAFSETVRESSWTRNSEFKMFRMTPEKMKTFNPDVFGIIQNKLIRNYQGLKELLCQDNINLKTQVLAFNTVEKIEQIEFESVDIVITSPPYGDSKTTVAYGQFSRLANQWLGIENAPQIDNLLMGGKIPKKIGNFANEVLNQSLAMVAKKDLKRAREVAAFYQDYQHSIANVAKTIKPGGYACYVVGNRRVKGVTLPTDEITKSFFETQGFTHLETIIRNIPNKRMPSKNSPTNVVGALDTTMCNEFIVIMHKKNNSKTLTHPNLQLPLSPKGTQQCRVPMSFTPF